MNKNKHKRGFKPPNNFKQKYKLVAGKRKRLNDQDRKIHQHIRYLKKIKTNPKLMQRRRKRAKLWKREKSLREKHTMLVELSKYVASKNDLNWIQAKWKISQIAKLIEMYKHGKSNKN